MRGVAAVLLVVATAACSREPAAPAVSQGGTAQRAVRDEQVGGRISAADGVALFSKRVAEDPRDHVSSALLAEFLILRGRETGAPADYEAAEIAARQALALVPDDRRARLACAAALLGLHRFVEALGYCDEILAQDPRALDAVALAADAATDAGRYEVAAGLHDRLRGADGSAAVLARLARWEELHGRVAEALELATSAIRACRGEGAAAQERAWYEARHADLCFHAGHLEEAAAGFESALRRDPALRAGLLGLADVRSAQGRPGDAVDLATRACELAPDDVVARFALAAHLAEAGRVAESAETYDRAEEAAAVHPALYGRTLASRLADEGRDLPRALSLVDGTLVDRDDVEGHAVRAWVLHRMGRDDEARAAMTRALRLGTLEPEVLRHAAAICRAVGDEDGERVHIEALRGLGAWHLPADEPR